MKFVLGFELSPLIEHSSSKIYFALPIRPLNLAFKLIVVSIVSYESWVEETCVSGVHIIDIVSLMSVFFTSYLFFTNPVILKMKYLVLYIV